MIKIKLKELKKFIINIAILNCNNSIYSQKKKFWNLLLKLMTYFWLLKLIIKIFLYKN